MDRGIANVTGSGAGCAVARCVGVALAVAAAAALWNGSASAQVLAMTSERSVGSIGPDASSNRAFRPESDADVPARLRRQIVEYSSGEAPGTVPVAIPPSPTVGIFTACAAS